jgi:acetyltransferase-like isoleucine patch superfamily enzyme
MTHKNTRKTVIGKSSVSVGRFTYGHENIAVKQWGEGCPLDIGAFCSIADNVQVFLGGNHRTDWITTFPFGHIFQTDLGGENIQGHPATNGGVSICNDVWIGWGATIMSGISIGNGAVIAANSTVVKMYPLTQLSGAIPLVI